MSTAAPPTTCSLAVRHRPRGPLRHRASTALLSAGAVSLIGSGVMASWSTTTTATTGSLSAATTAVRITDAANLQQLSAGVSNLLPGDFFHRYVDVHNDGTSTAAFTGSITASADLAGQVTAQVERCPSAWTGGTCSTTPDLLLATTTIGSAGHDLTYGAIGTGQGGVAHLRYRLALSSGATTAVQGKTGTLTVTVTGDSTGGRDRTTS